MKKLLTPLFFVLFLSIHALAVDVSISYATFSNKDQCYVEVYLHVVGSTITTVKDGDFLSSQAEVTILIKKDDAIIQYEKYILNGPSTKEVVDFQDLKRMALDDGDYQIEVMVVDINDPEKATASFKDNLKIKHASEIALSDIQLVASTKESDKNPGIFSKHGYDLEILPFAFIDSKYETLTFYTEIYNLNLSDKECFIAYAIKSEYEGVQDEVVRQSFKKLEMAEIAPVLQRMDIKDLPSGNYHLSVELYDRDKQLLTKTHKNFRRSNPLVDIEIEKKSDKTFETSFVQNLEEDKLDYYLRAIAPVVRYDRTSVLNSVIRSDNVDSKRYFLYSHYSEEGNDFAEEVFNSYMKVADAIHNMFYSGFGYGFETDKGYMYLKYGRPTNSVTVSDEPSAPPYEIWVYDQIAATQQTNVKFIFYNPSLSHNDFELLHSTCRGELFNPAWEIELYRDALSENNNSDIDATRVSDGIYRNARRLFEDL